MNPKHERRCSRSRRRFLGSAAAGGLALAAGAGTDAARSPTRGDPTAEALLRRYGGEFGELEPGER